MEIPTQTKLKICLVGEYEVGKTCLIRKYVFNEFSDNYICTIGTNVTKKKIRIRDPKTKKPVFVQLLIWDIMGRKGLRQLLRQAYYLGAQGIIGVCDNTREKTLSDLDFWIDDIQTISKEIPTVLLGNKCDLEVHQEIGLSEIRNFAAGYEKSAAYLSSAKTGHNVDCAFHNISEKIISDMD
jgi:small GTP-binding protein